MKTNFVLEIDITYRTLGSNVGGEFRPDSKEYVVVEYDSETNQARVVDYGYRTRQEAEWTIKGVPARTYQL